MKIFGLTISRSGAAKALESVPQSGAWRTVFESFSGAWQTNTTETQTDVGTYPTLYACVYRIASDVGKLPFMLVDTSNGISVAVSNPAYSPVLAKPNHYQTAGQFRERWMLCKLINGNAYVLKERDARGVVVALYILDPEKVTPLISDSGEVFYRLRTDSLSQAGNVTIPASEVIHDRCVAMFHPLVGVPPVSSANWAAIKNLKVLKSSTDFFGNNAQPGGLLTAPAGMSQRDADQVKEYWAANFTGTNAGKVAVIGADMKFTPFAMKSIDAQMIEHLRYGDEQICQPFGIPPFKVGIGAPPAGLGVDGLNQLYYADALQTHIEHMEALLNDGLRIREPLSVELDLEPLLRMDEAKRADVEVKLVAGKIKTPDEGRARFNLAPTGGGDTLWGQNQDYPLGMLADRMSWDQSMQPPAPAPENEQEPEQDDTARAIDAARRYMEASNAAI